MGVASLTYNRLELVFRTLFRMTLDLPESRSWVLFARLQNDSRLSLLKAACDDRDDIQADLAARVLHFHKAFGICAENRNAIMHSNISMSAFTVTPTVSLLRLLRSGQWVAHPVEVSNIRRTADEMHTLASFGLTIAARIPATDPPQFFLPEMMRGPLPDIPPLPSSLDYKSQ
jgi:hypothetical protein